MEYQIKDDLQPKEYNELRNSVGWDSKDESVIIEALRNSVIIKKIMVNNKAVGMARAIGDGLYYLIVDVVVNKEYQGKEVFYEKCGLKKIPFDFTGYGMIRRIKK